MSVGGREMKVGDLIKCTIDDEIGLVWKLQGNMVWTIWASWPGEKTWMAREHLKVISESR